MKITEDIQYIGVYDQKIDLFEGQYEVPDGISYNSYVILDEKIAVMDTVDAAFTGQWLANLESVLDGRMPDYLVVQHMEPDHSANILQFTVRYPNARIVASARAFAMMKNFFGTDFEKQQMIVGEGQSLSLGNHQLTFVGAPMVHWPEVIMTYDSRDRVLFSADGFGKFGSPEEASEGVESVVSWAEEARRYYIGIVGKYGAQVQSLLQKAGKLDIQMICPLHGPVLRENLGAYMELYHIWSGYRSEEAGTVIAYTSVYGNTRRVVMQLADMLRERGQQKVVLYDLSRCSMSKAVADAFRYSQLVLAGITYNGEIFPPMREFLFQLLERNFRDRKVALIENGSWAPRAAAVMEGILEKCKNLTYARNTVRILSALSEESNRQLEALAEELTEGQSEELKEGQAEDLTRNLQKS